MPPAAHALPNSFRFNARNVFLTYPKCAADKLDLLNHFKTFKPTVAYGIVSHELHEDGSDHLHALIGFVKKYSTRDQRSFDFRDHHPNIQSPRVLSDVADYVRKDGDFVEFGALPIACGGTDKWKSIADSPDFASFMKNCKELSPKVIIYIFV
jgi:hypothetical protein